MAAKTTSTRKSVATSNHEIPASLIEMVCQRLERNQRLRRTLPVNGRLHVDRQLPFLCVYRRPPDCNDLQTQKLVNSQASYLFASADSKLSEGLHKLIRCVAKTLGEQFGAFLIVEIWPAADCVDNSAAPARASLFRIVAPGSTGLTRTIDALARELKKLKVTNQTFGVEVVRQATCGPPGLAPLLTAAELRELKCATIGLEVPPVYRNPESGQVFPLMLRSMRRGLDLAFRQAVFEFSRTHTTHVLPHFHALGRKAVVKAVWEVDKRLAEISDTFDYLLLITPLNSHEAWQEFESHGFDREPDFQYRPLHFDPGLLKRQLFRVPVERVEDPALQHLFQEKQEEIDLKITMLRCRNTPRFLLASQQLFGRITDSLVEAAHELLQRLAPPIRASRAGRVNASEFARCAEQEFEYYRSGCPEFTANATITSEVSGLMVSRGDLLIGRHFNVPQSRVNPLLQHEVGTHLLTYYNGRAQPFRQLEVGLAGYEDLQEGLAVLSEYLVGGLSRLRMQQLAARVIAVRSLVDGESFVDTFRQLRRTSRLSSHAAFTTTMRVYRGGGFTKDALYLRGLHEVLRYFSRGGELEPLLVGKLAVEHIPIIKELQYRKVLAEPKIRPRYLENAAAVERLADLRGGTISVRDLVSEN